MKPFAFYKHYAVVYKIHRLIEKSKNWQSTCLMDFMRSRQNQNKNQEHIHYCDLSSNLDSKLRLFSDLAQATDPEKIIFDDCMAEFGESVIEYLGKRTLLEHVFFGRTLTRVQLEDAVVKAELWRLRKIKAGLSLKP